MARPVKPHGHPLGVTGTLLFLLTVGQVLSWKNSLEMHAKTILAQG